MTWSFVKAGVLIGITTTVVFELIPPGELLVWLVGMTVVIIV